MKLKLGRAAVLLSLVCGIFLCAACGGAQGTSEKPTAAVQPTLEQRAEKILSSMSLSEKVGQMIMIGVEGTAATEDSLYMLHQYHIGGIILYDKNMKDQEQVREFTQTLQREAGQKVPLFFAVDEEGGLVARMKDKLPPPPAAEDIAATGDLGLAENVALENAKNLKAIGFNTNFAPVADIASPRKRSYGADVETVTKFVQSTAKGYESGGIIYCLKHFPGIGKGKVDTHVDTDVVDLSLAQLEADDMIPFGTIIKEKNPLDYFVMVSHVTYPQLDPGVPATLSKVIQTDILRGKLGYRGVIITDSVSMGALSNHYSYREIAPRAVKAGADIVLINHDYPYEADLYLGLLDAAEKGEIDEARINDSVRRILMVKLKHLSEK